MRFCLSYVLWHEFHAVAFGRPFRACTASLPSSSSRTSHDAPKPEVGRSLSSSRVLTGAGRLAWVAVLTTLLASTLLLLRPMAGAGAPSGGFEDRAAISGLTQPTAVEFASGGTVFVAEKRGVVKVLDNL